MTIRYTIQTLRAAYRAGMIHRILRVRLLLLFCIALIGSIAIVHDVFFRDLSVIVVAPVVFLGMLFGYYVMAHLYDVKWHEQEETLTIGRLDVAGILILCLYVFVRIIAYHFLLQWYVSAFLVSGLFLALFWGIIVGRLYGIIIKINRLFRSNL